MGILLALLLFGFSIPLLMVGPLLLAIAAMLSFTAPVLGLPILGMLLIPLLGLCALFFLLKFLYKAFGKIALIIACITLLAGFGFNSFALLAGISMILFGIFNKKASNLVKVFLILLGGTLLFQTIKHIPMEFYKYSYSRNDDRYVYEEEYYGV